MLILLGFSRDWYLFLSTGYPSTRLEGSMAYWFCWLRRGFKLNYSPFISYREPARLFYRFDIFSSFISCIWERIFLAFFFDRWMDPFYNDFLLMLSRTKGLLSKLKERSLLGSVWHFYLYLFDFSIDAFDFCKESLLALEGEIMIL